MDINAGILCMMLVSDMSAYFWIIFWILSKVILEIVTPWKTVVDLEWAYILVINAAYELSLSVTIAYTWDVIDTSMNNCRSAANLCNTSYYSQNQ